MAKNLVKRHGKYFQTLSLLFFTFVVIVILILTYYVIHATVTTNSEAAGLNCVKNTTKSKCVKNGCSWFGSYCSSSSVSGTTQQQNNQAITNDIPSGTVDCGSYATSKKCYTYGQNQCAWNGFSCVHSLGSKSQLLAAYLKKYNIGLCNSLSRTVGSDGKSCLSGLDCKGTPYAGNFFSCTNSFGTSVNCCPPGCGLYAIPGAGINACLNKPTH